MSQDGRGRGSPPDGGDGKDDGKNRACDACRRMKIRCIDKENPPCKRCRTMKLSCTFDMGAAPRMGPEEFDSFSRSTKTRLESLEGQVGGINRKLDDISSVLHGLARHQLTPATAAASASAAHASPVSTYTHASDPSLHTRRSALSPLDTIPTPSMPSTSRKHARAPTPPADGGSDEDDPLEMAAQMEPFRELTRKEEEERLMAEGYLEHPRSRWTTLAAEVGHRAKRRRADGGSAAGEEPVWAHPPVRAHGAVFYSADPVTLQWCSEAEGRELFEAFFKYAHPFLPLLDPREDTWDHLRERSPFLVTVILYVALRARDGCNEPSELTRKTREQAENMAQLTLFSPIATLETVQSLALLSTWTAHGWRISCHAVSLGVDMRLYRCLPYLYKTRHDTSLTSERQRSLVVGARLWLALVKQTYEMSYNHALPVQFTSPFQDRTRQARSFLEHPLSNIWDSRLVVSVELLEVRECVFRPLQTVPAEGSELDDQLRQANLGVMERYEHWLEYYHRHGLPSDHYLVKERELPALAELTPVKSQKSYAVMSTNSMCWYGVRSPDDVLHLPRERRQWLGAAVRSAAFLISSIGAGPQQEDSEYANHNFHVGIVATARYLIRMVELLPDEVDLYKVSLDIDKLLLKLPHYPSHPFSDVLRRAVTKAREQGVLPVTAISEEASRASATVLHPAPQPTDASPALDAFLTGFSALPWNEGAADAAAQPNRHEMDPTLFAEPSWPDDFNILTTWFAGIDASALPPADTNLDGGVQGWLQPPST